MNKCITLLILLLNIISITATDSTCNGNCPSGNCPNCECGETENVIDSSTYCSLYDNWSLTCC